MNPAALLIRFPLQRLKSLSWTLKKDYTIVIVNLDNMQQAARIEYQDYTGFFLMGELVEFDQTRKIFHNPREKLTEDYITVKLVI